MRIWDIPCSKLCDRHLLGEHRELHCIWTCLTTPKGSNYKKHPETLRWKHNQKVFSPLRCENDLFIRGIRIQYNYLNWIITYG